MPVDRNNIVVRIAQDDDGSYLRQLVAAACSRVVYVTALYCSPDRLMTEMIKQGNCCCDKACEKVGFSKQSRFAGGLRSIDVTWAAASGLAGAFPTDSIV